MLEQGIRVQLRQADQVETTGRPQVHVVVGPGYPIAVSEKPFSAGYPGRGQLVVFSWRKQDILGVPRVADHDD